MLNMLRRIECETYSLLNLIKEKYGNSEQLQSQMIHVTAFCIAFKTIKILNFRKRML